MTDLRYFIDLGRSGHMRVVLAGVGGTGSQIITGLARINATLRKLGEPGFTVMAYDPDIVTEANVGRQLFSPADIGCNKAAVLITRLNLFFGTKWEAVPHKLNDNRRTLSNCILFTAVDKAQARIDIAHMANMPLWIDTGNGHRKGQVVIGTPRPQKQPEKLPTVPYLPNVCELFPDIRNDIEKRDETPSCSVEQSLERQDLFINQFIASIALDLFWRILRTGQVEQSGAIINLANMQMRPIPIDPEAWARMGYKAKRRRRTT